MKFWIVSSLNSISPSSSSLISSIFWFFSNSSWFRKKILMRFWKNRNLLGIDYLCKQTNECLVYHLECAWVLYFACKNFQKYSFWKFFLNWKYWIFSMRCFKSLSLSDSPADFPFVLSVSFVSLVFRLASFFGCATHLSGSAAGPLVFMVALMQWEQYFIAVIIFIPVNMFLSSLLLTDSVL